MELLAALVGTRLTNSVIEALNWKEVKCYYWSDSTTVLAWISREENWFVDERGRCSTIYCDNGTNFVGAANLLHGLDWSKIIRHGAVNAIDWKFNPPTAAWWGG
ncbi:hypothetical protein AVEN_267483-1 [Araneus ventricosus]|uniref:Integrase catalytic domain-containing protein n=1 Tax=Araneus ventricosus TaxID=182803 RepID=A0A4Y2ULW6_ARAVE|nr:hypothetical protein AVEN_267483-1 [Araneus ventricosus]